MMNKFLVYFDFTTVHKGGRFVGRSGKVCLETIKTKEQIMLEIDNLNAACFEFIQVEKPKWNVFMINVKQIEVLN